MINEPVSQTFTNVFPIFGKSDALQLFAISLVATE